MGASASAAGRPAQSALTSAAVTVCFLAAAASGFCPHACTCDEALRSAACPGSADLDIIPITLNPNIESLVLAGNRIKTVDASIQFYRKLQRADFSDNRYEFALCRRQKNERLDLYLPMNFPLLSIPRISVLPDSRLNSQKLLRNLTLDSNKIANLTNLTFVGLRSLRRLSMRENLIRELRPNVFAHLEKVRLIWCRPWHGSRTELSACRSGRRGAVWVVCFMRQIADASLTSLELPFCQELRCEAAITC